MGQVIGQSTRDGGEPATEPIRIRDLMATITHTVFDDGRCGCNPASAAILRLTENGHRCSLLDRYSCPPKGQLPSQRRRLPPSKSPINDIQHASIRGCPLPAEPWCLRCPWGRLATLAWAARRRNLARAANRRRSFPAELAVVWRQKLGPGYSGVSVAEGKVITLDRPAEPAKHERVVCFAADSGKLLWQHSTWPTTKTLTTSKVHEVRRRSMQVAFTR